MVVWAQHFWESDCTAYISLNDLELLPQWEILNNQSLRQHIDNFTQGQIIGKTEEGQNVTSVAEDFGILHSMVSRRWRSFQTTGTLSDGSAVVVHQQPRQQTICILPYRQEGTGCKHWEKSQDTWNRRLDDRYRVLPCTVVVCLHDDHCVYH